MVISRFLRVLSIQHAWSPKSFTGYKTHVHDVCIAKHTRICSDFFDSISLLLQDLLQSESDLAKCFSRCQFLVLDEADRLLEPSFETELVVIAQALPSKRQTLLFSATMTKSLVTMQDAALRDAYCFQVSLDI